MNTLKQQISAKDVKISKRKELHRGFCNVYQYTLKHKRFAGDWTSSYTRELVLRSNAVGAIPYDPRLNKVVLIEQLRIGAIENKTPWLFEIVAGLIDHDPPESLRQTLCREMREEAGLEIYHLLPIANYLVSPGCSTSKMHLFCAHVDATRAPQYCGLQEEHEDIKIHVVSAVHAFSAVRSGKINNSATIIALQWLELNLERVRKLWVK